MEVVLLKDRTIRDHMLTRRSSVLVACLALVLGVLIFRGRSDAIQHNRILRFDHLARYIYWSGDSSRVQQGLGFVSSTIDNMRSAFLTTVLAFFSFVGAQSNPAVDTFLAKEIPIAKRNLVANIGPDGAKVQGAKVMLQLS
jgi:hypothetical protein